MCAELSGACARFLRCGICPDAGWRSIFPKKICKSYLTFSLDVCISGGVEESLYMELLEGVMAGLLIWITSRGVWLAMRILRSVVLPSSGASDE